MSGLIGLGQQLKSEASQGLGYVEGLEQQQELQQEQLDIQSKNAKMSAVGAGAATGAMVAGPWGALIGAGVGFIGSLF